MLYTRMNDSRNIYEQKMQRRQKEDVVGSSTSCYCTDHQYLQGCPINEAQILKFRIVQQVSS